MPAPSISFVMSSAGDPDSIRNSVEHHARQTIAGSMELIVVSPLHCVERIREAFPHIEVPFHVIGVPESYGMHQYRAAGFRAAQAECVAFCEDHAFHHPAWGEIVVQRIREGHVAVGPMYRNANPGQAISRAEYLHCFGYWAEPMPQGTIHNLPWHNSAYWKQAVLALDGDLEHLLSAESLLQEALSAKGGTFWLETSTPLLHANISRWCSEAVHTFHHARMYGAARSSAWSFARKLVHFGITPLVPLRLIQKSSANIRRAGWGGASFSTFLALTYVSVVHALGEAIGYFGGAGDSAQQVCGYEMSRARHVVPQDRSILLPAN